MSAFIKVNTRQNHKRTDWEQRGSEVTVRIDPRKRAEYIVRRAAEQALRDGKPLSPQKQSAMLRQHIKALGGDVS